MPIIDYAGFLLIAYNKDDKSDLQSEFTLRLDNTGARVIEVYTSLLCNRVSEQVDLYIKLKLGLFSSI